MRDYGKVSPHFWIGDTGRAIRARGRDCQVVALYLLTCPANTGTGLYYLPIPTLCHEIGCPIEGASKALLALKELDFAHYDDREEVVYVPEMAHWQVGPELKPQDKRHKWFQDEINLFRKSKFYGLLYERYRQAYSLPALPDWVKKEATEASPSEAPSKPHRSQEHEQEQEHEKEQEKEHHGDADASRRDKPARGVKVPKPPKPVNPHHAAIRDYFCDRWAEKYQTPYDFGGAKDAAHIAWILRKVGQDPDRARAIVDAYLADDRKFLIDNRHTLGVIVSQWARYTVPEPPTTGADNGATDGFVAVHPEPSELPWNRNGGGGVE
jgi:hypothetical protein